MRNTLGKSLGLCFTKIKLRGMAESSSSTPEDHGRSLPYSTTKVAASSSVDLIKNFNSLYDLTFDSTSNSKSLFQSSDDALSSSGSDDGTFAPDFATVFASQRFFFSSPGRSNSIIDSSSQSSFSSPEDPPESDAVVGGGIAIPTYSPDPYNDFRRSMQEMVEARDWVDVTANWDNLHELLTCYLALNPKSAHKFIVSAFADLLVSLITSPTKKSGGRSSDLAGNGRCI